MRIHIQSISYHLWKIIVSGPHIPSILVNGISIPKLEEDWNEYDIKQIEINAKAMNLLYCALDLNEFNRVSTCTSTKEIWDTLEVTHEGTLQVKNTKINLLIHSFEIFEMMHYESISDMFSRFMTIINELKSLGKIYTNADLVNKILRSLPKSWDPKVTAIQEAKDVETLPLEELIGSLMTYELNLWQRIVEADTEKKIIALKAKKKFKAMMATWSDSEDSSTDDEVAHLCFMANEKKVCAKNNYDFTFKESHDASNDLVHEYRLLKIEHKKLNRHVDSFSLDNTNLANKNDDLNAKIDILKNEKNNFSKEKEFLEKENVISKDLCKKVFNKKNILIEEKKQKLLKNFNIPASFNFSYKCGFNAYPSRLRKVWVPKGTIITNHKGPKKVWVPKMST